MKGSTLYLTGLDAVTGEINAAADCCLFCKRLIINAGIATVVVRRNEDDYDIIKTSSWLILDEI